MSEFTVGGIMLRDMLLTGAAFLERNKESINALNVFPVPDGDTGTNMSMTMQSAVKSIRALTDETVTSVADALSLGALKGARGNSGVILSQIFRGFARALKGAETIDAKLFSAAFEMGADSAYKAVMRPKEGTMLTVIREISNAVKDGYIKGKHIPDLMDIVISVGEDTLKKTPEMLPVLKEAGVVDSGGMGLMAVLYGFKMALNGEEADEYTIEQPEQASAPVAADDELLPDIHDLEDIHYGYCTEFFVINPFNEPNDENVGKLREKLSRIGDSIVAAFDTGFIKIHVHTDAPGKALQLALQLGEIDKVKIENMREQNREVIAMRKASEKECAVIAVCAGDGIETMFHELGAGAVILGGQTMNPSIDSIAKAIRRVNARNVFVLPNNSNIILAAQQAAALTPECNVVVVPTKTIMQGISAIMAYNTDLSVEKNTARMTDAASKVISGSVTYAVRTTTIDGHEISEGDIIAMLNGRMAVVDKSILSASQELIRKMIDMQPDDPVVTVIYGENIDESSAEELVSLLTDEYPDAEFIVQRGGQPLYYYYFSIE